MKLTFADLSVTFLPERPGDRPVEALRDATFAVGPGEILTVIGPAGSGKTSLLRAVNRLHDENPRAVVTGDVRIDGDSIYGPKVDVPRLRQRAGMVFSRPVPLPGSIRENLAFGLRAKGVRDRAEGTSRAEEALRAAALWDEVADRLDRPARALSGGQQQRLCLARAIAASPEIILLDEPTSALDPISTARIEDALVDLSSRYTIVLVTNNVKQAARIGTKTAFFLAGRLVEHGDTGRLFTAPREKSTEGYITGRFG